MGSAAMAQIASHLPPDKPQLAFVNGTVEAALATLDRVATVTTYVSTTPYANDGLSQALKTVAGILAQEGFDLCAFVLTPQTGGREQGAKLCGVRRRLPDD